MIILVIYEIYSTCPFLRDKPISEREGPLSINLLSSSVIYQSGQVTTHERNCRGAIRKCPFLCTQMSYLLRDKQYV
ncbi:hypothetical protein XELAEV_18024778mg [Xenopus laevis]|uniref:Uncharacterized protein n=1 Tax=Xenopus laevis TaxID=8355 RepID=A0A974CYD4_XENLA|nr:hypothetical protein XELAEV_18024778mg [Xenopus laevis]